MERDFHFLFQGVVILFQYGNHLGFENSAGTGLPSLMSLRSRVPESKSRAPNQVRAIIEIYGKSVDSNWV